MTGGLGFTSLMKSLTRENRKLLRHTENYKSQKDKLDYSLIGKGKPEFKKLTDEELLKVKQRIRQEAKKERRKELFILLLFILISIVGLILIF